MIVPADAHASAVPCDAGWSVKRDEQSVLASIGIQCKCIESQRQVINQEKKNVCKFAQKVVWQHEFCVCSAHGN